MKKFIFCILVCLWQNTAYCQTASSFSIHNITGTSTITCVTPAIHYVAFENVMPAPYSYSWTSASAALTGSEVSITVPGIYTVTSSAGSSAPGQTLSISINTLAPLSTISPLSQTITCQPGSATTVTASALSATAGVQHNFAAPFGGTLSVSSYSALYIPGAPGTYTYLLTDTINGCSSAKTFTVNSTAPFSSFELSGSHNFSIGCGIDSVVVVTLNNIVTDPPGNTVAFSILGPPVAGGMGSYSIDTVGSWTVGITDVVNGCETWVPFTVTQNTVAPTLFVIVPTQSLTCRTASTTLFGFSSAATAISSEVRWTFPGDLLGGLDPFITVYTNTVSPSANVITNYTVWTFDPSNDCNTYQAVPMYQSIYVPTLAPAGPFNVSCPNPTVQLFTTISGSLSNCVFSWNYPPQANVSGAQSATLTTDSPGAYTLSVTDTLNACVSKVQILAEQCVGIKTSTFKELEIKLYPNPVSDKLELQLTGSWMNDLKLTIQNSLGQTLYEQETVLEQQQLDMSTFRSGIYFLKLQNNSGQKVFKVIKE